MAEIHDAGSGYAVVSTWGVRHKLYSCDLGNLQTTVTGEIYLELEMFP